MDGLGRTALAPQQTIKLLGNNRREHIEMANLGNAWHIPNHPEPRGQAGMRDPVGAIVPGMAGVHHHRQPVPGRGEPRQPVADGKRSLFQANSGRKLDVSAAYLPAYARQ